MTSYFKIVPILVSFLLYKIYGMNGRNVITEGKGKYELNYKLHDRVYRIKLHKKRGPSKIVKMEDCENDQDITEKMQEYLGPNEDFHGSEMTPRMMNFNHGIRVFLRDETILSFDPEEVIKF